MHAAHCVTVTTGRDARLIVARAALWACAAASTTDSVHQSRFPTQRIATARARKQNEAPAATLAAALAAALAAQSMRRSTALSQSRRRSIAWVWTLGGAVPPPGLVAPSRRRSTALNQSRRRSTASSMQTHKSNCALASGPAPPPPGQICRRQRAGPNLQILRQIHPLPPAAAPLHKSQKTSSFNKCTVAALSASTSHTVPSRFCRISTGCNRARSATASATASGGDSSTGTLIPATAASAIGLPSA